MGHRAAARPGHAALHDLPHRASARRRRARRRPIPSGVIRMQPASRPTPSTNPAGAAPPGPKGNPIFGVGPEYLRDPMGFLMRMRQEFGGLVHLPLKVVEGYLVSDPALIERVFATDSKSYIKDRYMRRFGDEALGQGLLTSDGD